MKKSVVLCCVFIIAFGLLFVGCSADDRWIGDKGNKEVIVNLEVSIPAAKPNIKISDYNVNYCYIAKIADGLLYFGNLEDNDGNAPKDESGKHPLGIITKYDFDGNIIWNNVSSIWSVDIKLYELPDDEGFIVYGGNYGYDIYNYYLKKFDAKGNEEWLINDINYYSLPLIENGGFVVAVGRKSNYANNENDDVLLVKFDFDGNVVKQKSIIDDLIFDYEYSDIYSTRFVFKDIIKSPDGYILVGNYKYDSWMTSYNGPNFQIFVNYDFSFVCQKQSDVYESSKYIPLDDGALLLCAFVFNHKYYELKKLDFEMNEVWSVELPSLKNGENVYLKSTVAVLIGEDIYIAAHTYNGELFVVRLSLDGELLWESELIETKYTLYFVVNIYEYNDGYLLTTEYYEGGIKKADCLYFTI